MTVKELQAVLSTMDDKAEVELAVKSHVTLFGAQSEVCRATGMRVGPNRVVLEG